MIRLKAALKGLPFSLDIDGKKVVYTDYKGKVTQWFPPEAKEVIANLSKEEYTQWHSCRTEEEVYRLVKFDLLKNGCIITKEERT